jgi:hypothetical protein
MMKRLILCCALAFGPLVPAAVAQGVDVQQVVDQLRDLGYREIRISQTFLGRTRIVATSSEYRREIVINPATGAIIRDYWRVLQDDDDTDGGSRIVSPSSSSSGDDADDDDDDGSTSSGSSASSDSDDDDDDDGGSSGSSSGSSSGGGDDSDDDDD